MILLLLCALQEDGWTKLQVGYETVEVYRDSYGVPHLFARTVDGAFWAEGYTEVQDRWEQMETFRRTSKGELAEIRGQEAVASDLDVRLHGYTEAERRTLFEALAPRTRRILSAYSAGVNACLQDRKIVAREWTETDSLAIGIAMARRFGEAGDHELEIQQLFGLLAQRIGEEKAKKILLDLLRESDPTAPATLHDHHRGSGKEGGFLRPSPPMEGHAEFRRLLDEARAARSAAGWPDYFGSNAWVVSPAKSKSGRPMLYGGPMMGFRAPSICNEVHLVAPGMNVGGMSFPGAPGVMIGFNDRLAWTTTSGGADLVDVFALTFNEKGEYLYQGAWRALEIIEEKILVKGGEPKKARILRTVHGPIAGKIDEKNRRAHALRYSFWKQEGKTLEGVLDMTFARDVKEFEMAAKKIVTSHNFFVADRDGHIGFWYCGAHPKRKKGHDPRFPQPGDGTMDWEGILPVEEWPQAVDPKPGFFANWNNKPCRSWEPSAFGRIFWGKKIIDELESREKISFEEFQSIARATAYHCFLADYFKPFILEAANGMEDADAKKAGELLAKWDHLEVEGDPRPTIVERWVRSMTNRVFGAVFDPVVLENRELQRYLADPLLYLLEGERCPVKLGFDWIQGRDLRKLAREALTEALKPGWEKLAWKSPTVGFRGAIPPVKSKGGRGTFQMTVEIGPERPRAETIAPPGQSGNPESKHFRDQTSLFEKWEYKKFLWKREEMK